MHLALQDARESVASPILDNKSQTMASVSPATSLDPIVSRLPSNAPFTVKNVATKGFGVFATRDIKMGELILAEEPLIIIEESHYMKADVEAAFNALTEEKQKAYLSLASAHAQDPARYPRAIHPHVQQRERSRIAEQHEARTAEEKSLLSICMTNAMESNDGLGVFEMASRFNHDCVPSASFAWDGRKGVETIHAVRDIAEGEVWSPSHLVRYTIYKTLTFFRRSHSAMSIPTTTSTFAPGSSITMVSVAYAKPVPTPVSPVPSVTSLVSVAGSYVTGRSR